MKQRADSLEVVVLAAGQGKRMASRHPKVLHPLAGRPLLRHVLDSVAALGPARTHVVVGHGADAVRAAVTDDVVWVHQEQRRGTGHAVGQALPGIGADSLVLVVYGDVRSLPWTHCRPV
jgi:bifunctional UDP-N-acetylglucosamine pyrophosphorylase / glucosamine-1-phosphate N-acetyltransferase